MLGNLAEMAKLMSKAKDIQKNMASMKEEMCSNEYSACSLGNKVEATVSGDLQLRKLVISPEAMQNKDELEEQIIGTVNSAIFEAKKAVQEKMKEITGGLDIPGLF